MAIKCIIWPKLAFFTFSNTVRSSFCVMKYQLMQVKEMSYEAIKWDYDLTKNRELTNTITAKQMATWNEGSINESDQISCLISAGPDSSAGLGSRTLQIPWTFVLQTLQSPQKTDRNGRKDVQQVKLHFRHFDTIIRMWINADFWS